MPNEEPIIPEEPPVEPPPVDPPIEPPVEEPPVEEPPPEEPPVEEEPPPEPLLSKSVVQLDADCYYQGMTTVDEDPMNRGNFMLPPMAFDITPPVLIEGRVARWNLGAGSWMYYDTANPLTSDFDTYRSRVILLVDSDVDLIYKQVIGNRAPEYEVAERDALDFAAAEFLGDPPASVVDWADIKGWTPQQAAENIIVMATQWRHLSTAVMRPTRLRTKEQLRQTTTSDEVTVILSVWQATMAAWKQVLGI